MQDKIIAAIAAYLEKAMTYDISLTKIQFERTCINGAYEFIQQEAEQIAAAIAPLVEAGENKNLEEAKTIVVKVSASLVRNQACEYAEDLNLPKTTPITSIRKFEHEARVWNDTNRLRAIELKRAYDLMK